MVGITTRMDLSAYSCRWLRNHQRKLCRCRFRNRQWKLYRWLPIQKSAMKIVSLPIQKSAMKTMSPPIQKSLHSDGGVVSGFTFFWVFTKRCFRLGRHGRVEGFQTHTSYRLFGKLIYNTWCLSISCGGYNPV